MTKYDTLNAPQKEATFHYEGPMLILAGAGSGKTRVLTHRIAWLIEEQGVSPWNIMAITFTNKAAGEMKERVDKMLEYAAGGVWVTTFHSTCVRILRRHIERLGYSNNFTIYDADDQKTLIKEICKQLNVDTKMYKERYFMSLISSAKDELIGPQEYALKVQADFRMKKTAEVYAEYQRQLKNNNALDFDDLICKTVDLFQTCPDILDYYQEKFRFIMVDEYQDTNTAQFKLISLLAAKYKNLCVVGDDDQSIYKFRGANIGNILNFEKYFPEAKVIRLEQNYRSTKTILNTANEVISHNVGRKQKRLWTENPDGEKVRFRQMMTSFEEAEYVADELKEGVNNGKWSYGDCAILYRTNAQSRMFEEKFIQANIPYKIVGGVNFYARKEIKDILAYLKTIANASDDVAVRRIINVPRRGIGATTIGKVQDYALSYGMSFYEALENADLIPGMARAASKLTGFVKTIQAFRGKAEFFTIKELINDVLEVTGYLDELRAEGTEEAEDRINNIDELLNKAASYDEEETEEERSLDGFLQEVALVADIDSLEEDVDRVLMMTLHSAKGLEFPNVFLVGMEDGVFPSYMSITGDDPTEIEEERRLCYVGITRAKEKLYLTAAKQRMVRGEVRYSKVSRFVEDIPKEYLAGAARKATSSVSASRGAGNAYGTGNAYGSANRYGQSSSYANPYAKTNPYARSNPYASAAPVPKNKPLSETGVFDLEQFKVKKSGALDYQAGDRVKHIKFGVGTVKNIVEGGRDFEVTVEFDRVGVKKMFASFAKLVKV